MPAPAQATYAPAVLIAATTAFLGFIDGGAGAGFIRLRSEADVLLAQVPLTDPAGTINGTTGQLTLTPAGLDTSADATGICTYAEVCDSNGNVHLSLPATTGESPQYGKIVLNTTQIEALATVEILSAVIG